jgi:hypothetical protein
VAVSEEHGNIVSGVFTPVPAKHSKSFDLIDTLAVGVDRIQRNLEPMQRQVKSWRQTQITGHLEVERTESQAGKKSASGHLARSGRYKSFASAELASSSENSQSRYFRLSLLLKITLPAVFEAENACV